MNSKKNSILKIMLNVLLCIGMLCASISPKVIVYAEDETGGGVEETPEVTYDLNYNEDKSKATISFYVKDNDNYVVEPTYDGDTTYIEIDKQESIENDEGYSKAVYSISANGTYTFSVDALNTIDNTTLDTKEFSIEINELIKNEIETPADNTTNSGVNTLEDDGATLSMNWKTETGVSLDDSGALALMYWEKEYTAQLNAKFPSDSTKRKVTVETLNIGVTVVSYEDNNTIRTQAEISRGTVNTTASLTNNGTAKNYNFNNQSVIYDVKDASDNFGTTLNFTNSKTTAMFSNNPASGEDKKCVKVTMSYVLNDEQKSKETYLSVNEVEYASPFVDYGNKRTGDYKSDSARQIVLPGQQNVTTHGNNYMCLINFKSNTSGTKVGVNNKGVGKGRYIPIKSAKLTLKVKKGLIVNYNGDSKTTDWVEESKDTSDSDYDTIVIKYNREQTSSAENGTEIAFNPKVSIPQDATNGTKYELSVMSAEVVQYESYTISFDGLTATSTGQSSNDGNAYVLKNYDKEGKEIPWSTAYYMVGQFGKLFSQSFNMGETISFSNSDISDDHYNLTGDADNIAWYNEDYKEAENLVGYYGYGNYGNVDYVDNNGICVDIKFPSTEIIGVRGLRVMMSRDDYNKVVNKEFNVKIATTKNPTLHEVTVNKALTIGTITDKWGKIYLDSSDLRLDDDEYLTEIKYEVTKIYADFDNVGKTATQQKKGGSYDWIIGRILNQDAATTPFVSCTLQLLDSEGKELTGEGKSYSKSIGTKRIASYIQSSVTGIVDSEGNTIKSSGNKLTIAAGETLTIKNTITRTYYGGTNKTANMGYTPVTHFYIRDLFGGTTKESLLSSLTIQNSRTSNYLVKDGEIQNDCVTITEREETGTNFNNSVKVKVYDIAVNKEKLENKWDIVAGQYTNLHNDNKGDCQDAYIYVIYDIKIPNDFNETEHLTDTFNTKYAFYIKTDNGLNSNGDMLHCYSGNSGRADEFDVDSNNLHDGDIKNMPSNEKDQYISRAVSGIELNFKTPDPRSDVAIENMIKESSSANYRTYDSSKQKDSSVDLSQNKADLRILVGNYSKGVTISGFVMYLPIPKKGQTWTLKKCYENPNSNIVVDTKTFTFNFSVNLLSELTYEDSTNNPFTIQYATISPDANGNVINNYDDLDGKNFENWNDANASSYNCIKISASGLPSWYNNNSGLEQAKATKYFNATIGYGDVAYPTSTIYDVWTAYAKYTSTEGSSYANKNTLTHELGLRANGQYKASGEVKFNDDVVDSSIASISVSNAKPFDGETVTSTITINNSLYSIDSSNIKVTVGGSEVTYTYDSTTNTITVDGEKVTGDVKFIVPLKTQSFKVTTTVDGGSSTTTENDTPSYGTDYETTVTPNSGYELPKDKTAITVTVGDKEITDFTYDPQTGKITVPGNEITGDIVIKVKCPRPLNASGKDTFKNIDVATSENNGTYDGNNTDVSDENKIATISVGDAYYGESLTATATVINPNFTVDRDNIKVTVGDQVLDRQYYTISNNITSAITRGINTLAILKVNTLTEQETWTITVDADKVTGEVYFEVPLKVNVSANTTADNGKKASDVDNTVPVSDTDPLKTAEYVTKVYPDDGYSLPASKDAFTNATSVYFGSTEVTDYTYELKTDSNGKTYAEITIPGGRSLLTKDELFYKIKVVCIKNPTNDTSSNTSNVSSGGHAITCEEYNKSRNWTWSKKLGKCIYKVSNTSSK